jgi:serine/threonine-protein kinase
MSSNESKIPVGTLLVGKYRVAREIGRGGMAAVYEAEQLSLGKKVAVKVLASELSASTIVIERFFREARAAASVKSPYIVDVYDSGRLDDGRPFIAMELLEGESLYDRMARVRIIDVDTTIRVIVHTARGLVKAHAAGIVHRDLKPENIFLTKGEDGDDVCKILDFGLAKFYAPVNPEEKAAKRLTREGAVFGTPAYMSPEQVKGQGNVDHRADLWALGCMAYECLIGRPVWNMDQGVAMTFAAIATGPIPVPSAARADLPVALDQWFKKCLERDPGKRYQSARELADAFVVSWGQRPTSSASFPNVNMSGGTGKNAPNVSPAPVATGEAQELSTDVLESLRPPPSPGVPPPAPSNRAVGPISDRAMADGRLNGRNGSVASDTALPLVQRSFVDVPPATDRPTPKPRPKASPLRVVMSAVFLGGSISAALFVWLRFLNPQVFTPVVQSTATAPPSAVPSGTPGSVPSADDPKWVAVMAEAQRRFTAGDTPGWQQKLGDANALGPQAIAIAKVYRDQFNFITSQATGPCKPVAFSRPRIATEKRAERPAIRATPKGMLVTWTDDHEHKDHDHVYGVLLDGTGKAVGAIRDLSPEATDAQRPQLAAPSPDSDRTVLLYADKSGKETHGIKVRFLDADGRIDSSNGASHLVGAARDGDYWPTIDKSPKGFYVVWQDDRDKEKEFDVFARALTNDLDTIGPETRLTDYHVSARTKSTPPRVRYPSVAVAANTLLVAYRLDKDREKERQIIRMRVPLNALDKPQPGLDESKDPNRDSRELGDTKVVNVDKAPGDAPVIACGTEGCFIAWHGEQGGAYAAMIDPNAGIVQWGGKFSDKGGRPSIAVSDGQVALSFYEADAPRGAQTGRIKMAFLTRDGVGKPTTLLRINDVYNPRPSLAAGAQKGEWTLAWQDSDTPKGAPEVYAARIVCGRAP